MKKIHLLILFIPAWLIIVNCNTVMSRLQPEATPQPISPDLVGTPADATTEIPSPLSNDAEEFTYIPARIYRDADWAVEMGWYTQAELAPPTHSLLNWTMDDVLSFTYLDIGSERQVEAVVRYVTPHFYLLFEEQASVEAEHIARAAELLETEIYPFSRSVFGEEWSPGVDGDPHIVVLHMARLSDDRYGEFGVSDECPVALCSYSNGHEMFYITLDSLEVGSDEYLAVVAHELQHLISYNTDGNEANWVDEGLSTLAETLNGYDDLAGDFMDEFLDDPDRQLDSWPVGDDDLPNYGSAYLFMLYLYERFGDSFIHALAHEPHDSLAGVETVLQQHTDLTLNQVFGQWAVANILDDTVLADGLFGYAYEDLPPMTPAATHSKFPLTNSATVHQFAVDYVAFEAARSIHLTFDGNDETALLPTSAHSGEHFWWSNRLDNSIASLQTELDLTGLNRPKVKFWIWYDIEVGWDVVMIQISDDGGQTWEIVKGRNSSHDDWWEFMFTGQSGSGLIEWVSEEIDLRRWEGETVLLRFQYITDSHFTGPGFALDDFTLESDQGIQRQEDFEANVSGWEATGFVYAANTVPQHWTAYAVAPGPEPDVLPITLDEDNRGEIDLNAKGSVPRWILVVAATAPLTAELATYTYEATLNQ